jgi:glycosyltransferase involved in cell wall biosynthesis
MKIAIIAPTNIPAKRANTLQVMKMAQAFVSIGHEVRLAVPLYTKNKKSVDYRWGDIAHHYGLSNEFQIDWLLANRKLRKYDFAWRAVQWARLWEPDFVYTRLPQAAALSAQRGLSTILEVHDFPKGKFGSRLFKWFLTGEGAIRMVVISKSLALDLNKEYRVPADPLFTLILPDGVDLIRYLDLPTPSISRAKLIPKLEAHLDQSNSHFFPDKFTAGYTGHLYPGRGINLLLDIAERLKDMNFILVGGESSDVQRVRETAQNRGLSNVTFTGFIPNAELPLYQAACDVLLMPYQRQVAASSGGDISRYLSPMKLFEYLACGRAICSSDLPVLREILSDEIAVLIQPDDIIGWVDVLRNLRENPKRWAELAENARQTSSKYSWDSRAKNILEGI